MRSLLVPLLVLALLSACAQENPGTPPDITRFYYPTGVAWQATPDAGLGFLYVVSSNFDLRFNRGTVASVDLSTLEPMIETTDAGGGTIQLAFWPDGGTFISQIVTVDNFGGPTAWFGLPDGGERLFVAGRQNNRLQGIDVNGASMTCAQTGQAGDCYSGSVFLSLSNYDLVRDAYRPFVATDGNVYVSHITPIDHPTGSNTDFTSTVAQVDALTLGTPSFIQVGPEPTDGLAQVDNLLFIGGRIYTGDSNVTPLRRLDLADPSITVVDTDLSATANVIDSRQLAASTDGSKLYVVIRDPSGLVTLDTTAVLNGYPSGRVIGLAELPAGADELAVIPRGPGRGDVVAIVCTDDGSVAFWDVELQAIVAVVHGMGALPYGIAVGTRPQGVGVRLYVTNFGQGNVSVIDVPDLDGLTQTRVLLNFGADENCLSDDPKARPPECPL